MQIETEQYRVMGVDRASGSDVEILVDAATEDNARAKADLRGVIVTSVTCATVCRDSTPPDTGLVFSSWRFVSLETLGFRVSPMHLLLAACVAVVGHCLNGTINTSSSLTTAFGAVFGSFALYLALGLFVALRVWMWKSKSRSAANCAFFATVLLLFGVIRVGQTAMNAHANSAEARGSGIEYAPEPSSAMVQAQNRFAKLGWGFPEDRAAVSVIIWDFSRGVPWTLLDRMALRMTHAGREAYSDWKAASVHCGHNPFWTEREHQLFERYRELEGRLVDFKLANGRYPEMDELQQVPVNPFTGTNSVAPIGWAAASHGWTYEGGGESCQLKAVVPLGIWCRSVVGDQENPEPDFAPQR